MVLITHGIHATEVGGSQSAARLRTVSPLERAADPRDPGQRDPAGCPVAESGRLQWLPTGTTARGHTGRRHEPAVAVPPLHRARQQSRLVRVHAERDAGSRSTRAHNVWHPQIVHDIHQQGRRGARFFFPPYLDPVEPNVDPRDRDGVNQLGTFDGVGDDRARGRRASVSTASTMPGRRRARTALPWRRPDSERDRVREHRDAVRPAVRRLQSR